MRIGIIEDMRVEQLPRIFDNVMLETSVAGLLHAYVVFDGIDPGEWHHDKVMQWNLLKFLVYVNFPLSVAEVGSVCLVGGILVNLCRFGPVPAVEFPYNRWVLKESNDILDLIYRNGGENANLRCQGESMLIQHRRFLDLVVLVVWVQALNL